MDFLMSAMATFVQGGLWMWVILVFAVIAIAIGIERGRALFAHRKLGAMNYVMPYEEKLRKGELKESLKISQNDGKSLALARVIEAGVSASINFAGKDEIQAKMDEVLLEENAMIERRTGYLATIANVATLTGLLGTIAGMIKSFTAVTNANPAEKATLLAGGISEAMNTTAFGLVVAIPCLLAFAYFTSRSNLLREDLNQAALKVFNWLSYSAEPLPARSIRQRAPKNSELSVEAPL